MKQSLKTHHSIDSFGIKKVSLSSIRVERLEVRVKPAVPFPHKHDFFQVLLITEGNGWHLIDFEKHKVGPGNIFFMKPGQMHSWELSKNIQGILVEFGPGSLASVSQGQTLMNELNLAPDVIHLKNKKDFGKFVSLALSMENEFSHENVLQDLCLQGYLITFLVEVMRNFKLQSHPEKMRSVIEKLKELIEINFKRAHKVEFYAKALKVSSKSLTMQLARSIGKPPRQLIQERILLEAKRYLAFSNLSIAEIGYELGFEDANYFTRFFRLHVKRTPAEFRKRL